MNSTELSIDVFINSVVEKFNFNKIINYLNYRIEKKEITTEYAIKSLDLRFNNIYDNNFRCNSTFDQDFLHKRFLIYTNELKSKLRVNQ